MQMENDMEERKEGECNSQGLQQFNFLDGLKKSKLVTDC